MKIQMFQVVWKNKAFLHVIKKGNMLLIYVFPRLNVGSHQLEIPSQYKKYKDVFGKKKCWHLAKTTIILLHNWFQKRCATSIWTHLQLVTR
jgi:hypothetical protein